MLTRRDCIKHLAAGSLVMASGGAWAASRARRPNVVLILADDIGYGDLGCYGAAHVKTPNLDRLARDGVRFTDAHATAAVCTPTRYSLLTGQYAFRNPSGDHILSGVAPLSIDPAQPTAPSLLKQAGYTTGLVGKWHLGLGTPDQPVDFNGEIRPGPLDIGFDEAFFIPATGDRVPCVFVENRRVAGLDPSDPIRVSYEEKVGDDPTGLEHPELLKIKADVSHSRTIVNGISRIGYMSGGKSARWVDEDMADTLAGKAVNFIKSNRDRPFFLYFAPHDIHEPMVPHPRFRGTSDCGWRGDVIHQLDWEVGQVLDALDELNLADNTLVIFASDNGGAIKDTYDDGTNSLHARQPPNGSLRGAKGSLYEGGHRIPFIARWPGHTKPGTVSEELLGLVDMPATLAALAGVSLSPDAAPDSFNQLSALLGENPGHPVRDHLVLQNNGSKALAILKGNWKLIANSGSKELYDLAADPLETEDQAGKQSEKVKELATMLELVRAKGRSRP